MTADAILAELQGLGSEQTKAIYQRHGAREPLFGVKTGDLKPIQKRIGRDYLIALELYQSGNSDAMYLAGLIADEQRMTIADLQGWVEQAYWYLIAESTVAWVAAESRFGRELANRWIEDPRELVAAAGWATWSSLLAITPSDELDLQEAKNLLQRIEDTIHTRENRVRYAMNGFVISAGTYEPHLTPIALTIGQAVGRVFVEMGGTACKVPFAPDYIEKALQRGGGPKKKKQARC